jgi:hypothetical protein
VLHLEVSMTRDEKAAFITNILDSTKEALLRKLDHVPETWDGHELRAWIEADVIQQIGSISLIKKEPKSKRAREFHNDMATRNL